MLQSTMQVDSTDRSGELYDAAIIPNMGDQRNEADRSVFPSITTSQLKQRLTPDPGHRNFLNGL